ncbi:MAG: lysophospholipid acyltransferase family protein [Deltaproteobacteria bacterium]|nr:lysophospholipid acyltransferase family protein [Deltaproteobacteria bacterium]
MILFLKSLSFLLGHLPSFIYYPLSRGLGYLAYSMDKKRRRIVKENLDRAFGDKLDAAEKCRIAKEVYKNLAVMLIEFLRIPWLKKDRIDRFVTCEGLDHLEAALERKKGVILLTGHFGNWELLATYFGLIGYPLDPVIRELDNPGVDGFVSWVRTSTSNKMIPKNRSMRKILKRLSENGIVTILLDQNVALVEGVFVDFFGTPACTNKGPALIAAASGAAVVPAFIVREGRRHRLIINEPIETIDTGDREKDVVENTRRMTKVIEDMARAHPEQWFWVHRRWKTRPPAEGAGLT